MIDAAIETVALYAGLNIVIAVVLAILVVRQRLKTRVSLGSGGNEAMERAIRAHANNAEYMAVTLPGLIVLGLLGAADWLLHATGILLTGGRVLHAIGLTNGISPFRQFGTLLTWIAALFAGIGAILLAT